MSLKIDAMQTGYGRQTILKQLELPAIAAGSLVAVVGANAVGKSTLLKSLAGLLEYRGLVELDRQSLNSLSVQQRMTAIGYLPQTLPQATSLVAYELVYSAGRACCAELSKPALEARIEQIFERLGIRDLALMQMKQMSGGQRQMIGLAQVLVRKSRLLLLDEPTSALDLHWQLNVLQAIHQETRQRQAIALVASHDLNLALRFCDQILMLHAGGVLAFGPPVQVLTPELLRQAYRVKARIERCSQGYPIVLADQPCTDLNP